ncbi:MAG: MFS transporter [Actinobacteria bacterium]|nr:MFS transporter [Actinomycetota bacterium]
MQNVQRKVLSVLALGQVLGGLGVASTVAAGSLLVAGITGSEAMAGLAQTSGVLGAAAMAIPLSKLTSRGGRRLALTSGYALGALGALFAITGGSYRNIVLMLIGTFLVGAASAAGYQSRFAAVDLATDVSRARNLSVVVWGATIGAVAGPNLMEPSGYIALHFGLPQLVGPYLFASVTLTLAAVLLISLLRPDPYLYAAKLADAPRIMQTKNTREVLQQIRKIPRALLALLTIAIGHVVMVSIMVMTPVYMAHVDVQLRVIGIVISIHVAGMYAFSPVIGWLTDQLGRFKTIGFGFVVLLTSTIISGTAGAAQSVQLAIGLFLLGLGWSATLIAGSTLLAESVPQEIKTGSQGVADLVMNLSGALGGALAGIIITVLSYGWLCAIAAMPVVGLSVYLSRVWRS